MHGLGNDFIVIDAISQRPNLSPETIRQLSDRRFGIGCDQVLVVDYPTNPEVDFRYRIYNADGGEVENCGNGARCFAKFVRERKLTGKSSISVETSTGIMVLNIDEGDNIRVDMGEPEFSPEKIPFISDVKAPHYTIDVDDQSYNIGAASMGNPHAVMIVENVDTAPVLSIGPKIEIHPAFPKRVNVGFMEIISRSEVNLRVFERGVGETLACGTGACAAVACGIQQGLLESNVTVHLPGGDLTIYWEGPNHSLFMTGPATSVFHGQVRI
jgi:diaminopimelate epimerase